VSWLAQDADGVWWCYQVEPNQSDKSWYENEVENSVRLGKQASNPDWMTTLKRFNSKNHEVTMFL